MLAFSAELNQALEHWIGPDMCTPGDKYPFTNSIETVQEVSTFYVTNLELDVQQSGDVVLLLCRASFADEVRRWSGAEEQHL